MRTNKNAFTLIELVMVIIVLGVLAVAAMARFSSLGNEAKVGATKGALGSIRSAVMTEYVRSGTGVYPSNINSALFLDGKIPKNKITGSNVVDCVLDTVNGTTISADGWWYVTGGLNAGQVGAYVDGKAADDSSSW